MSSNIEPVILSKDKNNKWNNLYLHFSNDWPALLHSRHFNWVNFTILRLEVEDEKMLGIVHLFLGFFGICLTISYKYATTEKDLELNEMVEAVKNGTAKTITGEEILSALKTKYDK